MFVQSPICFFLSSFGTIPTSSLTSSVPGLSVVLKSQPLSLCQWSDTSLVSTAWLARAKSPWPQSPPTMTAPTRQSTIEWGRGGQKGKEGKTFPVSFARKPLTAWRSWRYTPIHIQARGRTAAHTPTAPRPSSQSTNCYGRPRGDPHAHWPTDASKQFTDPIFSSLLHNDFIAMQMYHVSHLAVKINTKNTYTVRLKTFTHTYSEWTDCEWSKKKKTKQKNLTVSVIYWG